MKNILIVLIGIFTLGITQVDAQATEKEKVEKKVVIKKKIVDKDGKEVVEVIEAEGEEAEALIKKMEAEGEMEDVEIDIKVEGGKTKKTIRKAHKIHKDHKVIQKSHDGEKMIKVSVDSKGKKDGENIFIIKVDDGDEERVIEWTGEEGEIPEEMQKYLQEGNMKIKIAKEEDMEGATVWVERDDSNLPEVSVRMGVELTNLDGIVEVGGVQEASPAKAAGLQEGDLITEIDGYHIQGYNGLMEKLAKHKPGDKIEVRFIRDGKAQTAHLTLAAKE